MKVCVVDPSLFTLPYDRQLCAGLQGQGVEVTLAGRELRAGEHAPPETFSFSRRFYRWTEKGSAAAVRRPNKWLKAIEHPWSALRAARWLRTEFDVIHFQWSPLPVFDGWQWRRLARSRPIVFTVHDTTPFLDRPTSRAQRWGWRALLDRAHRLIVHTRHSADVLQELGVAADRVTVIPHGPLYPGCDPAPSADRIPPAPPGVKTLLFFGEIKPYKGLDVLLRAAARLDDSLARGWRIVVVGRPRCDLAPLQELAGAAGMPVIWRTGFVPESEIHGLFTNADAVVFPYRQVDASGALMLALPFGRPVVATRVGLFAELLEHEHTALLAEPGDVDSLARALERLMREEALRAAIATNIRARLATLWSWEHIAAEHVRLYRELLAPHPERARIAVATRTGRQQFLAQ